MAYKLLLTREKKDNQKTKDIFLKHGIKTLSLPMIEIKPLSFELMSFDFDSIIFSSQKAVDIFFDKISICKNANIKIYAVGQRTAKAIKRHIDTDIYIGTSDIKEILNKTSDKALWIRTELELPEDIKSITSSKNIFILKAYETVYKKYKLEKLLKCLNLIDGIFFASPSAFYSIIENLQNCKNILHSKELFAIGNTTKSAIEKEGFSVSYTPASPSIESLAFYIKSIR